jgi:transcription antitermination factor NusG
MQIPWVAVQVRPRHEKIVATALYSKGIDSFLPLYAVRRRWSDRVQEVSLPLFDGYVFCQVDLLHRMPVLTIPNVIRIVGVGKTPVPIEESEIQALQSVMKSGQPSMPWPYLHAGQRVRVEYGALKDLEGILVQVKGTQRLVLSVSMLQRSIAVEVDRDSVVPVSVFGGAQRAASLSQGFGHGLRTAP